MLLYFIIYLLVVLVLQINLINEMNKHGDSEHWNKFIGITVASFFSIFLFIIAFLTNNVIDDLGIGIIASFLICIAFGGNIVLLIMGIDIKEKIEGKLNKTFIKIISIVISLNIIVFIILPIVNNVKIKTLVSKTVVTYLNNKYGDNQYKVISVGKDFTENGFVQRYHTGYTATISSPKMKKVFTVSLDGKDYKSIIVNSEEFVEEYYEENVSEYLLEKYDSSYITINIEEKNMKKNYGYIPTINELIDCNAINELTIVANGTGKNEFSNGANDNINYLIKVSKDLINYLKISKDVDVLFVINHNDYKVQISGDIIKVTDENKKTYKFSIN